MDGISFVGIVAKSSFIGSLSGIDYSMLADLFRSVKALLTSETEALDGAERIARDSRI